MMIESCRIYLNAAALIHDNRKEKPMTGQNFIFGGRHLTDFGFIMAKPNEEDSSGLNREVLKGTTNSCRSKAIHYGTVYNSVITLPFLIVKFNPRKPNDSDISAFELRKLQSWLTSSQMPQPLYLIGEDGSGIEYHGIFTDISPFAFHGLHGLSLKFTCDSPFAYDTKKIRVDMSESTGVLAKQLYCDTDENGEFIYPTIQYTPNSAGTVSFANQDDGGSSMRFTLSQKYDEVIIDCGLKRILADGAPLSLSDVGWNTTKVTDYNNVNTGIYKMYWLRLLPGINHIDITGNGNYVITYKNLLKIGGLDHV